MRHILLFLSLCFLFPLFAQAQDSASASKASLAFNASPEHLGGFVEVYIKPKISIWTTVGFNQLSRQLSFGEDTVMINFFTPAAETKNYFNLQRSSLIRVGVRIYKPAKKQGWSFWYSPVIGYRHITEPTDEYVQDYARADRRDFFTFSSPATEERDLELGGEIGTRWTFWRKPQSSTGLYLEGSTFMIARRSLLKENSSDQIARLDLRAALGFTF